MENRYEGILREHNAEITASCPVDVMRFVMAHEFQRLYKPGMSVLEIGCGEGDSAEPLLCLTDASMVLLDASAEMIKRCEYRLAQYAVRTDYMCADALEHLRTSPKYDIIVSSWTIHNFLVFERLKLFLAIYERLTEGGTFLLMDKVYPKEGGRELLELQCNRYQYLTPVVAEAMIAHEKQDYSREYRMNEEVLLADLRDIIGFRGMKIADRCESLMVLTATK